MHVGLKAQIDLPAHEELERRSHERMRREEFINQVIDLSHVTAQDMAPHVVNIPRPGDSFLAIRSHEGFGVVQILSGIVRAGNFSFGIASAHGKGIKDQGQPYLIKLNEDSYLGRPHFISPLFPSTDVEIGGPNGILPQVRQEHQHLQVVTNEEGIVRFRSRASGRGPFQWITGNNAEREEGEYDPLVNEINTWSLPPDFLQRALRKAPPKERTAKRSHAKTQRPPRLPRFGVVTA